MSLIRLLLDVIHPRWWRRDPRSFLAYVESLTR